MKLAVDRRLIAHLARLVAVAVFCVALGGPAVRAEGGGFGDEGAEDCDPDGQSAQVG